MGYAEAELMREKKELEEKVTISEQMKLECPPLGCTSPRPLGYINKEIFSPTQMPIGFGEAVQRMQLKRVQAIQEAHEQEKKREAFEQRYKNRLDKKRNNRHPIMHLEIVLGPNKVKPIVYYEDDDPRDVAEEFCARNHIRDSSACDVLYETIVDHLERLES